MRGARGGWMENLAEDASTERGVASTNRLKNPKASLQTTQPLI